MATRLTPCTLAVALALTAAAACEPTSVPKRRTLEDTAVAAPAAPPPAEERDAAPPDRPAPPEALADAGTSAGKQAPLPE